MSRFAALRDRVFDLVVIGGGIVGAGMARDAALRGLSVALVEKADYGGGTTSGSTRLIHGGLRYLEMFDFRLVRLDLREREILLRIAPHLVRPLEFLLPFYGLNPVPPHAACARACSSTTFSATTRACRRASSLTRDEVIKREPHLSKRGLKGAASPTTTRRRRCPSGCASKTSSTPARTARVAYNYAEVTGAIREGGAR